MSETFFFTDLFERFITCFNSTTITPDDRIAEHMLIFIHYYKTMHLVSDADRSNSKRIIFSRSIAFEYSLLHMLPPLVRTLFSPTRLRGYDLRFSFRE